MIMIIIIILIIIIIIIGALGLLKKALNIISAKSQALTTYRKSKKQHFWEQHIF